MQLSVFLINEHGSSETGLQHKSENIKALLIRKINLAP